MSKERSQGALVCPILLMINLRSRVAGPREILASLLPPRSFFRSKIPIVARARRSEARGPLPIASRVLRHSPASTSFVRLRLPSTEPT